MIGDRRGPNSLLDSVVGVSHDLPPGQTVTQLHCPPGCVLVGASTDRSDCYHQIRTTNARAASNSVGPSMPLSWFKEQKRATKDQSQGQRRQTRQWPLDFPSLKATRADLVFPLDALGGQNYLLRINKPQTRGRGKNTEIQPKCCSRKSKSNATCLQDSECKLLNLQLESILKHCSFQDLLLGKGVLAPKVL